MKFSTMVLGLAGLMAAGGALAMPGDLIPIWGSDGIKWTDSEFYHDHTADSLVTTVRDRSARIYEVSIAVDFSGDDITHTTLVSRFLADGAQDLTYGNNGWAEIALPEKKYTATAAALDFNGKLLVAGYFDVPLEDDVMFLCRLDASGKLDPTLIGLPEDHAGCTTNLGHPWLPGDHFNYSVGAILVQRDGKMVVVGDSDAYVLATRLNVDGTRDPTFGSGSMPSQYKGAIAVRGWNPTIGTSVKDAKFAASGAITIAAGTDDFYVIQIKADGSDLDQGFGGNPKKGVLKIAFDLGGTNRDTPTGLAIAQDGAIYVSGAVEMAGGMQMGVAKILPWGKLSPTFGTLGLAVPIVCDVCTDASADRIFLQSDGKIVLAGFVDYFDGEIEDGVNTGHVGVIRLLPNGSLDSTFGSSGTAFYPVEVAEPAPLGTTSARAVQSLIPHNQGLLVGGTRWGYNMDDTFQINISLN